MLSCACVEDQWNRLSPRERAEKEAFIAGEKSVTRGFMRMVCILIMIIMPLIMIIMRLIISTIC